MKIDARRIAAVLRDPGDARAVLLYGDDHGLIRERAEQLVRLVAGSLDDPFNVADLARDGVSRIAEEAGSLSLMGGRRVVRVREAGDGATPFVQAALDSGAPALIVLEAGELGPRSRLRSLIERAPSGAAISCHREEGAALARTIGTMLTEAGVRADAEALEWLTGQLGADRVATRSEVEKLALYVGADGVLDIGAAMVCVGDMAGLELEDALFAATAGDAAGADRALELAMAQGLAPVGGLRACLMHLQKLQRAGAAMRRGAAAGEAARGVRPPVFFRRIDAFTEALRRWPEQAVVAACTMVWEAERACKQTGAPAETLCRNAIAGVARRAAGRRAARS